MSHTKAIATQQTHPFHQGRNDSVLATASMISLAKILGICCSLGGKIETVPQIISRRTFPFDWMDGNGKDNLSPHSSFHKRVVGQRLVWWEQRCVLMSTSPGRPHLESLKIWRMVEILSSQGSSLEPTDSYRLIQTINSVVYLTWCIDGFRTQILYDQDTAFSPPISPAFPCLKSHMMALAEQTSGPLRDPAQHTGARVLFLAKGSEHLTGSHVHPQS